MQSPIFSVTSPCKQNIVYFEINKMGELSIKIMTIDQSKGVV